MERNELVGEVGADPVEVSSNAMGEFLDAIQGQNFTQAERHFNDMMMDRIQDSLEQRKVQIASQMFGSEPEDEEEDDEEFDEDELLDLSDDELEELWNEVEEDDDEDDDEEEDDEEEDE
jgi:hypothetical protein